MRFLGIGDYCDLGAVYLRLIAEGHEVKVHISNPHCATTLTGLVAHVEDWRTELSWLRAAGDEGIALFENAAGHRGRIQDELRQDGYNVIGGSAFGDRLENDRAFGQNMLAKLGLPTCTVHEFTNRQHAAAFLAEHPGRYVLKFNGAIESFVGRLTDGRDVQAFLAGLTQNSETESFILMPFLEGVEMGVGAYFNGESFLMPSCLDWEHKRFFPGDMGELVGEMGTVCTYERTSRFHELILGRMEPLLREGGYCGYINLNTIVNEQGIWPLEFTARFGYPGYAILDPLQLTPWAELFHSMTSRSNLNFATKAGFSVGIVMTTPPFPYCRPAVNEPIGLPILFDQALNADDRRHLHYGEVAMIEGQLVTAGAYGWTMVVTGTGATLTEARARATTLADRTVIPRVRYRRDIGERLEGGELDRIEALGLLTPRHECLSAA
jgi:phosphoribosylamine--glycine ligase